MAFDQRIKILKGTEVRLNNNDFLKLGFHLGDLLKVEFLHDEENKAVLFRPRDGNESARITVDMDSLTPIT